MKTTPDPLISRAYPDRLHYATGELLGAEDFRDEQTYHRRQLARALLHLHGSGAIAGLRVAHNHRPGKPGVPDEVEITVKPGIALDQAGRLVEVPREACLRLHRWYDYIAEQGSGNLNTQRLRNAWHAANGGAVVADVFLSFFLCPRGYTPAFASGPFDALDASQPSRVRDGYELSLVPRVEAELDLPKADDPWAAISGATEEERLASARELAMTRWRDVAENPPENPPGVDPTAVLLARLRIPAQQHANVAKAPIADWSATAWPDAVHNVDNGVRRVLLPPAALARVFGS